MVARSLLCSDATALLIVVLCFSRVPGLFHRHASFVYSQSPLNLLTHYYENRLSPAFSYIFNLGAPVPKELANIKTVYPYFVTVTEATEERVNNLYVFIDVSCYLLNVTDVTWACDTAGVL